MIVQNQIKKDEEEDNCWYSGDLRSRDETNDLPAEDPIEEAVRRCTVQNKVLCQFEENLSEGPAIRMKDRW
jgi:hypothetical protein